MQRYSLYYLYTIKQIRTLWAFAVMLGFLYLLVSSDCCWFITISLSLNAPTSQHTHTRTYKYIRRVQLSQVRFCYSIRNIMQAQ